MLIKSLLPIFHHVIVNPVCIVNINVSHYVKGNTLEFILSFFGYPEITILFCKYICL